MCVIPNRTIWKMPVQRSIIAWFGGIFVEFADSISTYLNFLIESNRLLDCCCCFLRFFNSISIEGGNTILVHIQLTNHILTEMLWGHNNTRIIRLNDSFTKAKQLIFQWFVLLQRRLLSSAWAWSLLNFISCCPFPNPINHNWSGHDYL